MAKLPGAERNIGFQRLLSARTTLKFLPYGSITVNICLACMKTFSLKTARTEKDGADGFFALEAADVLTHTRVKKGKAAVPVHYRHIGFGSRQLRHAW